MDEAGTTLLRDPYQWPLAHSESGRDKALKLYSSLVLRRENLAARVSAERSLAIPKLLNGWLQYTRADGAPFALPLPVFIRCFIACLDHNMCLTVTE